MNIDETTSSLEMNVEFLQKDQYDFLGNPLLFHVLTKYQISSNHVD